MRDFAELNINEGGMRVQRDPPSQKIICEFEQHYGLTLPADYLALLRFSNGGHPELDSFKPKDWPAVSSWAVNAFFFLNEDKNSWESLWKETKEWRHILGEKMLPFAANGGGSPFVLDLTASPAAVKACVHDENFLIVDLAPTFEAFIDGLHINPDYI